MRRTHAIEAALVAAALALVTAGGCAGPLPAPIPAAHPGDDTPRNGGVLHLASFADVTTLDPAIVSDFFTGSVLRLVYAGLVDFDREGNVVPDLASRVETIDDGSGFRFTLREGALFHDGTEVSADDVKRSIERALAPTTASPWSTLYKSIAGFDEYVAGSSPHLEGVVVEGRYVVAIHLKEHDAAFLATLAMSPLRVLCKSATEKLSSGESCGAGPFRIPPGKWEHGRALTLVRHEGYFRPGLPHLDGITWQLGSTFVSQAFKFARGDIDAARELTQADTIKYQTDPRWVPFGATELVRDMHGSSMNNDLPPFDNVEVRRAVAAAIDRQHLVMLKSSSIVPLAKPVPVGLPGYSPQLAGQVYDPAAALMHMAKAGYPFDPATGRGGWPAPIVYDVARPTFEEQAAQSLQQDLARIGLRIELRISSQSTFYALTHRRGTSQMSPQGWQEDFPDPSDFLDLLFSSQSINDQETLNYAFYRNPVLDADLTRAKAEVDPTRRTRLYEEIERTICDDAPWAFEWGYHFFQVNQPYVRNLRTHAVWIDDVTATWLDRDPDRTALRDAPFSQRFLGPLAATR